LLTWSLATIAPNREEHVSKILSDLEMDHRVFMVRQKETREGKIVDGTRLAFPGYMFVKSCAHVAVVLDITGVMGFVKFADEIIDVSNVVLDLEEKSVDSVLVLEKGEAIYVSKFSPGDKIRMISGVGSGLIGEFHQMISHEKAIVFLEFMGRKVPFTVCEHEFIPFVSRGSPGKQREKKKRSRYSRNFTRRRLELSSSGVGVTS
jgi:transcription antitermination factor NusG